VLVRVVDILANGRTSQGWPRHYRYRELAQEVYSTDEPSPAQLSAVRWAVAKLLKQGQAERMKGRKGDYDDLDPNWPTHLRQRENDYGAYYHRYRNPPGVSIRRPLTASEIEAQESIRAQMRAALG
jgi:hypothetical protein